MFSPHLKNGAIVQVAAASEYSNMEAFRRAILALRLETHLDPEPSVRFSASQQRARARIHLGADNEGGWQSQSTMRIPLMKPVIEDLKFLGEKFEISFM